MTVQSHYQSLFRHTQHMLHDSFHAFYAIQECFSHELSEFPDAVHDFGLKPFYQLQQFTHATLIPCLSCGTQFGSTVHQMCSGCCWHLKFALSSKKLNSSFKLLTTTGYVIFNVLLCQLILIFVPIYSCIYPMSSQSTVSVTFFLMHSMVSSLQTINTSSMKDNQTINPFFACH